MPATLAAAYNEMGGIQLPPLHPAALHETVTAGQTFKKGDLLTKVAAGTLSIAATAGNNVAVDICGVAQANAADCLEYGRMCPYIPLDGVEFAMPVYHATPASAVIPQADMGNATPKYEIRNQGGIWCIDVSATTNAFFAVLAKHEQYPYGETYGYFKGMLTDAGAFEKG